MLERSDPFARNPVTQECRFRTSLSPRRTIDRHLGGGLAVDLKCRSEQINERRVAFDSELEEALRRFVNDEMLERIECPRLSDPVESVEGSDPRLKRNLDLPQR